MPQQLRGRRRVAQLLRAADLEIGEAGYESATMCAIAARARSSVGSLYQFFSNKRAVAEALRSQYAEEYAEFWRRFTPQASDLDAERLAAQIIDFPLQFAARHPGFLPLFDAPRSFSSANRRQMIRGRIATALQARKPGLSRARAMRIAAVVNQIMKGLLTLCGRVGGEERTMIVAEFRTVLAGYLGARLEE